MYMCIPLIELLIWHKNEASTNGLIQSLPDFKRRKQICEKWLDFETEAQNIRLGLALDGVNPIRNLSSCHSFHYYKTCG
jgi:hypothetical protein